MPAHFDLVQEQGAELIEVPTPPSSQDFLDALPSVTDTISEAEALHVHRNLLEHRAKYTPQVLRRVLTGEGITAVQYLDARQLAWEWTQAWRALFAGLHLDAVAHPALAAPPPTIDVHSAPMGPRIRNSIPWSATGFPALSVPVGLDRRGLPVGLSLAALPEREGDLLALGILIDEEIALWRRAPGRMG